MAPNHFFYSDGSDPLAERTWRISQVKLNDPELDLRQAVAIGHRDATDNCTDDPDKALIGAAEKQVLQVRGPVEPFFRSSVDGSVIVRGETTNCFGGKDISVDHMPTEIRHEPDRGSHRGIVPSQLLPLIITLFQRGPAIGVGDGGESNKPSVQFSFFASIFVVVGRADDTGSDIAQLVSASFPVKRFAIIKKDDGFIEAEGLGLAIEDGDRFDEGHLAGLAGFFLGEGVAQPHRFDGSCAGQDPFGEQSLSVFQFDAGDAIAIDMEFCDSAAQLELSAQFTKASDEVFEDEPNAFVGSGETFEKDASKHNAELAPVHIVLSCVSIPHQGA